MTARIWLDEPQLPERYAAGVADGIQDTYATGTRRANTTTSPAYWRGHWSGAMAVHRARAATAQRRGTR